MSALLALRDAGVGLDGAAMQGWALAHGWSGDTPQQLVLYVNATNAGKRLRCRQRILRTDFVDDLRRRMAALG